MGIAGGPNLNQDGLVFLYDVFDQDNSYKGEPTENILYSGGDTELNDGYTWTNSGTWTYSNDDTSVAKPYIPNVNTNSLLIMSGVTETVGSQQIGCAYYASLTPSTTYTISVWFRQNRAGSNQPYFRTNINNNSLGNFSYNGDTDASNWPINQWIRISATATIQSNENGAFLSNYIGSAVGDKVWYFAPQLEAKSHMTPVTTVVRSATQGLLDVAGANQIDLTNVSFDSNAQIVFDGTNDYVNVGDTAVTDFGTGDFTVECIVKIDSSISVNNGYYKGIVVKKGAGGADAGFGIYFNTGYGKFLWSTANGSSGSEIFTTNTWNSLKGSYAHVVMVRQNGATNNGHFYINGIYESITSSATVLNVNNDYNLTIGASSTLYSAYYFQGEVPTVKIYNRALSAQEVLQNYNATKSRFGLK